MKLSESKLKQIIKEELNKLTSEKIVNGMKDLANELKKKQINAQYYDLTTSKGYVPYIKIRVMDKRYGIKIDDNTQEFKLLSLPTKELVADLGRGGFGPERAQNIINAINTHLDHTEVISVRRT